MVKTKKIFAFSGPVPRNASRFSCFLFPLLSIRDNLTQGKTCFAPTGISLRITLCPCNVFRSVFEIIHYTFYIIKLFEAPTWVSAPHNNYNSVNFAISAVKYFFVSCAWPTRPVRRHDCIRVESTEVGRPNYFSSLIPQGCLSGSLIGFQVRNRFCKLPPL